MKDSVNHFVILAIPKAYTAIMTATGTEQRNHWTVLWQSERVFYAKHQLFLVDVNSPGKIDDEQGEIGGPRAETFRRKHQVCPHITR